MQETKRLYRKQSDHMIAGVCAGLAEYLSLDPLLVRLVFVALTLANGLGLVAYLVLWLIVPSEQAPGLSGEDLLRANAGEIKDQAISYGTQVKDAAQGLFSSRKQEAPPAEPTGEPPR